MRSISRVCLRISIVTLCASFLLLDVAVASLWQMKQRDMHHTGRADYAVPVERLNSSFFDVFLWQKPSPGSPDDGCFDATSMPFSDGVGPDGADIVLGTYHWPKGIQGMDRHSGAFFWSGNPAGGETIARITPAFSADGGTLYVVNDYTGSDEYPNGHPLMAMPATVGPAFFWHNGNNQVPDHLSQESPVVGPDSRIYLHPWWGRPYAGQDVGYAIEEVWEAQADIHCIWAEPSLYDDEGELHIVVGDRWTGVYCFDDLLGTELWSAADGVLIDAPVTIDPANGNVYVAAGESDIFVIGLDKDGNEIWDEMIKLIYDHIPEGNHPQRAQSCGCLSHDGATYYFQTNSEQGDGALYAIRTSDGSLKWTYPTGSTGWEMASSCPIVTPNGVIVVGNNMGDTYLAILDEGDSRRLLDTYTVVSSVQDQSHATASATLSPEGNLYLPLRTLWTAGNGDGDIPTGELANVYSAFDLSPAAVQILPGPPDQAAFALNGAVEVTWHEVEDPEQWFDHYAIYRDTVPFSSVEGMTPVGEVYDASELSFTDQVPENEVGYYYAVTTVAGGGGEDQTVESIGPRTPHDETDLQVACIARTPRYPRYLPDYEQREVTEPSGFGPYTFWVAVGLEAGQDENTQRWPEIGDPITYTATVRNRGTNPWSGVLTGSWTVDALLAAMQPQPIALAPNETATFAFVRAWDGASHEIGFSFDLADARPENNALAIDTKSVAYLSFIDRTRMETFREQTGDYPLAETNDLVDWLNRHTARLNLFFAEAGCAKRVHFDVLEVIDDFADDPVVAQVDFAIQHFRYSWQEPDVRLSGEYDASDDIDYRLLFECAYQLGLIELRAITTNGYQNAVNGEGYGAPKCLMNEYSHFLCQHSAQAMTHWIDTAHGYHGAYLYGLPEQVAMHFEGLSGPLVGATVTLYQKAVRPGVGWTMTTQVKAQGLSDENGDWTLPNVPIDPLLAPPAFSGDALHDNPFGYISVTASNGTFLMKLEHEGFVDYAWLDITEVNNAYWAGATGTAVLERTVCLDGDEIQLTPPADMAELNASSWRAYSEAGTASAGDDEGLVVVGEGSVRLDTDGCGDNYLRYPGDRLARWDLSTATAVRLWCYAQNANWSFQNSSPRIRLCGPAGYIEYQPHEEILNGALGQWIELVIPIEGDETWTRSEQGSVSLSEIHYLQIHADTWDCGFNLWVDGVGFDLEPGAVAGGAQAARLELRHNAPNPFRTETELRFALAAPGEVDLAIFDVNGRRVRSLVAEHLEAGVHCVTWDGRDEAGRGAGAGIYFARLRAAERTLERKMVMR